MLILFWALSPKPEQSEVLDASGSVSDSDWRESLLFARDLAVQLNASGAN